MSGHVGFRFGDFEAQVAEGQLRRAGFRVRLQDLPFRLLVALAERPGELMTRDELQRVLWPSETYGDFGHRLGGALNRLREALGDSAGRPRYIETIPRRGYRFCGAVERVVPPASAPEPMPVVSALPSEPVPTPRWLRPAFVGVLLLAVSGGAWRLPATVEGEETAAVAVLPFVDLAGQAPGLGDALTEETISELSRASGVSVIGRTTAMAYRTTSKRVDEIARELAVDFVIEGSVSRGLDTIRVTVRLLNARSQTPVWSGAYEGPAADPAALQASVARGIAVAVRERLASP